MRRNSGHAPCASSRTRRGEVTVGVLAETNAGPTAAPTQQEISRSRSTGGWHGPTMAHVTPTM